VGKKRSALRMLCVRSARWVISGANGPPKTLSVATCFPKDYFKIILQEILNQKIIACKEMEEIGELEKHDIKLKN
jgi:hypothetical protein